jgi:hypothetical protein
VEFGKIRLKSSDQPISGTHIKTCDFNFRHSDVVLQADWCGIGAHLSSANYNAAGRNEVSATTAVGFGNADRAGRHVKCSAANNDNVIESFMPTKRTDWTRRRFK